MLQWNSKHMVISHARKGTRVFINNRTNDKTYSNFLYFIPHVRSCHQIQCTSHSPMCPICPRHGSCSPQAQWFPSGKSDGHLLILTCSPVSPHMFVSDCTYDSSTEMDVSTQKSHLGMAIVSHVSLSIRHQVISSLASNVNSILRSVLLCSQLKQQAYAVLLNNTVKNKIQSIKTDFLTAMRPEMGPWRYHWK